MFTKTGICVATHRTHFFVTGYTLSLISLFIMTVISVDTSLIVFGVEIQTIRNFEAKIFACNNITIPFELVIIFWTVSVLSGTSYSIDRCIAIWYYYNVIPLCLVTATFSYLNISIASSVIKIKCKCMFHSSRANQFH